VKLAVYNTLGPLVAMLVECHVEAEYHEVTFSAKGGFASGEHAPQLAKGVYFYQIQAGNLNQERKLLLLR
jgi:hypothetical protein